MLGLDKLNELIAFAIVHGFSQDGETKYKGGLSYIAELLMCDKRTAMRVMTSLEEKGLVEKTQKEINGVKFNRYSVPAGVVKNCHQWCQNVTGGSENLSHKNTNKEINNIIVVEDAHTHTREKSDFDYVLEWICDNEDGLQQMLYRNKLILTKTPVQEMISIILPYVQEYYEQQLMNGGEDIMRRGRRDIKQHFSQWLPKHLKKLQQEQQQKQQEYEQGIDPITRAMQDFAAGWDNAERRKQQEQCFERF
jgi:hypothetical protein